MSRLEQTFQNCKSQKRAALIGFVMAGDPNIQTSMQIIDALPQAGFDILEIGMPFSDPMADGPTIQAAGLRALSQQHKMNDTFALVEHFRKTNHNTPIILMGYFNPIYIYGLEAFFARAQQAGVDGVIIVDVPAEERTEIAPIAKQHNISIIPLIAPTTPTHRLQKALEGCSGFIYFVSVAGITGSKTPDFTKVEAALKNIRNHSQLPIAVGFGIKNAQQVKAISHFSDGVVVGSALIDVIEQASSDSTFNLSKVTDFVKSLRDAL